MLKKYIRLNKKAIATSLIVPMILGLVFAGLFLAGPLKGVVNFTLDKLAERGIIGERVSDDGFVPYETKFSDEDINVDNSIKALQCAISNTAKGGGFDASLCEEGYTKTNKECSGQDPKKPKGLLYGSSCVKCIQLSGPGVSSSNILESISQNMLNCYEKSKRSTEDLGCFTFGTHSLDNSTKITESNINDWLENAGGKTGTDLSGDGIFDLQDWTWKLNTDVISKGSPLFISVYADGSGDIILEETEEVDSDLKNVFSKKEDKTNKISCFVENFNLPQKIDSADNLPWNHIAGMGDPDYLLYYSAFEQKAAQYWHVDELSGLTVGMIIAFGVLDMAPGVGKVAKAGTQAFKEVVEAGSEAALRQAAKKSIKPSIVTFVKTMREKGLRRALLSTSLAESALVRRGVGEELAEKIAKTADDSLGSVFSRLKGKPRKEATEEMTKAYFELMQKEGFDEVSEEFFQNSLKRTFEGDDFIKKTGLADELSKLVKDGADDAAISKRVLDMLEDDSAPKKIKDMVYDSLPKKGGRVLLDPASLRNARQNIASSITTATRTAEKTAANTAKESTETYQRQIAKELAEEATELYGANILRQQLATNSRKKAIIKMFKELEKDPALFDETFDKAIRSFTSLDKGGSFIKQKAVDTVEGLISKIKIPSPIQDIRAGLKVRKNMITHDLKNGFQYTGLLNANWKKTTKRTGILALAYFAAMQDALNEKYASVGYNSLGLDQPGLLASPKEYDLNEAADDYFISMRDGTGELRNSRLYLASPCNANLVIKKEKCTCTRMPVEMQHYLFEGNNFLNDVKGITLNNDFFSDDAKVYDNFVKKFKDSPLFDWTDEQIIENRKKSLEYLNKDKYLELKILYPFFANSQPDLKDIKTKEQAIAAYERFKAVWFFEEMVNGPYVAGSRSIGFFSELIHGRENAERIDYDVSNIVEKWGDEVAGQWRTQEELEVNNAQIELFEYFRPFFNVDYAIKQCFPESEAGSAFSALSGKFISDQWSLNNNVFATPNYKPECITVSIDRISTPDNANYCVDEFHYVGTLRTGFMVGQIVASVALTFVSGGTAAPFLIAGSGMAAGFAEETLARRAKWPAVEKQGMPCTPDWMKYGTIKVYDYLANCDEFKTPIVRDEPEEKK